MLIKEYRICMPLSVEEVCLPVSLLYSFIRYLLVLQLNVTWFYIEVNQAECSAQVGMGQSAKAV